MLGQTYIDVILYVIAVLGGLAVLSGAVAAFITLVIDSDHHIEDEL